MTRDYLKHALRDAGIVELRHIGPRGGVSGLFDSIHPLRQAIEQHGAAGNLYTSLNRPRGVTATNAMTSRALGNDDFAVVTRLPFDFDPVRPTGAPSTDTEMHLAAAHRDRLVAALAALGWPAPAMGMSGNGAHALYRCQIPVADTLKRLYAGLAREFSSDQVTFDRGVCNPGRIWRLYGTANRKGTPTVERPHRLATVTLPARWEAVSPKLIEGLVAKYERQRPLPCPPPRPPTPMRVGRGDLRTLDVVAWFAAHGCQPKKYFDTYEVTCPWSDEHSGPDQGRGASVVWESHDNAWPSFFCHHEHCNGRDIRAVIALWGDADSYCSQPWRRSA